MASSSVLADAVATAAANVVQQPRDVEKAAQLAAAVPGILGAVIIAGDKLAAWGKVTLIRI
jgi:ApbE superfamily uncharacterized protein (UPF0280 family)